MIARLSATLALILACGVAQAQDLRVLSGEHDGFSRLAIVFPTLPTWRAGRTENGYRVDFEAPTPNLNLSRVFDLIPRDRIKSVDYGTQSGQLNIGSDCDCFIEVFEISGNVLVIDVKSGQSPANNQFEARLDIAPLTDPLRKQVPITSDLNLLQETILPSTPKPQRPLPTQKTTSTALLDTSRAIGSASPRTIALEEALIRSLGRAGSQGLVNLEVPETNIARIPIPDDPQSPKGNGAGQSTNLQSETSFERELPERPMGRVSPKGDACYGPDSLLIGSWDMEQEPKDLLPNLHAMLVTEKREIEDNVLRTVAKGYLSLGFGAEARLFLKDLEKPGRNDGMLNAMAGILDNDIDPDQAAFSQMLECPNASAMWALLETSNVTARVPIDQVAVQRGFLELPLHLRVLLGPNLSERLTQADQPEAARTVMDSLRRAPVELSDAAHVVEAQEAIHSGHVEKAIDTLEEVVSENSESSPKALIQLLNTHFKEGTAPPDDMIALSAAMITELVGTEEADLLRAALSKTLARRNEYEEAYSLARGSDRGQTDLLAQVADPLLSTLVDQSPDGAFLTTAFREVLPIDSSLFSTQTLKNFGSRLTDLGFAEEADQVLSTLPLKNDRPLQITVAKIRLKQKNPEEALRIIAGRGDKEATEIRAQAMADINNQAEAASSFADAGNPSAAASAAWLSGDQSQVNAFGNTPQSAFLAATLPSDLTNLAPDSNANEAVQRAVKALNADRASRTASRELVGQSEAFRAAAQELLSSQ